MQPAPATLLASRWYERDGGVGGGFMLQTLRHFWEETYEQAFNSQGLERARAALLASPAVRALMRNREAVRDALGWGGWVLVGGVVLFAAWEIGGFGVLVGQPLLPPAVWEPARPASADAEAGGCTQAALDRSTGLTISIACRRAGRAE